MFDIQHDSPTPIHEQIATQIMTHVAAGDLAAHAVLPDYRKLAQQLLTNPQVVSRAYADLEWEGVLKKQQVGGGMEVVAGADVICRGRIHDLARQRLRDAVRHGLAAGLADIEIRQTVEHTLVAPPAEPVAPAQLSTSIKKPSHASRHRDSQGIQDLSWEKGGGSP